VQVVKM